jgi:hypothetical protein
MRYSATHTAVKHERILKEAASWALRLTPCETSNQRGRHCRKRSSRHVESQAKQPAEPDFAEGQGMWISVVRQ